MNKNMDLLNLILDRRSCKEYRSDPLDRPTLAAIVEAGRYAPSGMNRQMNLTLLTAGQIPWFHRFLLSQYMNMYSFVDSNILLTFHSVKRKMRRSLVFFLLGWYNASYPLGHSLVSLSATGTIFRKESDFG